MRVLVTGVDGFIGSNLAPKLVEAGHEVWGGRLAGKGAAAPASGYQAVTLDILDRGAVRACVEEVRPHAIVHLAGRSHVGRSWGDLAGYFQTNVVGVENVLEAAEEAGGAKVLFASSAEVYGAVPEGEQPIPESRILAPSSPYALTKASAERLAAGRGAVIVRSFNVIGPGQSADFALPTFARQLASIRRGEQEPVLEVGNLDARRDFTAVGDAVRGYRLLLERGVAGEAYNLGSGKAHSIEQMLHKLIVVSGVRARIKVDPERLRPTDIPLLSADTTKLRALGWEPRESVDDALTQLWDSVQAPA